MCGLVLCSLSGEQVVTCKNLFIFGFFSRNFVAVVTKLRLFRFLRRKTPATGARPLGTIGSTRFPAEGASLNVLPILQIQGFFYINFNFVNSVIRGEGASNGVLYCLAGAPFSVVSFLVVCFILLF